MDKVHKRTLRKIIKLKGACGSMFCDYCLLVDYYKYKDIRNCLPNDGSENCPDRSAYHHLHDARKLLLMGKLKDICND